MDDARQLIANIPVLKGARPLRFLSGGPASKSWLLEQGDNRLVLRQDTATASKLGLDRFSELEVLERVSSVGIGPDIVWADPAAGLLVTVWVSGEVWKEEHVHSGQNLSELARTLRIVHGLNVPVPGIDLPGAARRYADQVGTMGAGDLLGRMDSLYQQYQLLDVESVLCHNDLVHSNIIGRGPVRLIDWEYAAGGDPLFDLAIVVRHHGLSEQAGRRFLADYLGREDVDAWHRLGALGELYDIVTALWYKSVCQQPGHNATYDSELARVLNRIEPGLTI